VGRAGFAALTHRTRKHSEGGTGSAERPLERGAIAILVGLREALDPPYKKDMDMATDQPEDLPPERDPPERPRRRRRDDDDDYDDRPQRSQGNSTNVILILLGIGAFVVVSGGCLVIVSIAAITALGSNANSTFSVVSAQQNVKYKPLRSDVDRQRFELDLFGKSPTDVTTMLGTPSMKKKDPTDANMEWWYYTGTNPATGLPARLPNTANGALVKLKLLTGIVIEVEWEPKQ
jgi:hypothetical protein